MAAFSGATPVVGDEGPNGHNGVTIIFPERNRENVVAAVKHAARYCPLSITLNGESFEHSDFLVEAEHVEDWEGTEEIDGDEVLILQEIDPFE